MSLSHIPICRFVTHSAMQYLLTTVESALVDILGFGIIRADGSEDAARALRKAIQGLCIRLIPHVIGLTDAFGFTDWELDRYVQFSSLSCLLLILSISALGVADGSVYQTLWEKAQTDPLNKSDIADGYEEYIRPILQRGQRLAGVTGAKL